MRLPRCCRRPATKSGGSASIGGQLLRAGLVDEVRIHLAPVLLGAGTRLLDDDDRGPIELDVAHAPEAVGEHYPGADHDLMHHCRILTRALFTTWRLRHDDQLPNGHYWRIEGLNQVRAALDRYGLDGARPMPGPGRRRCLSPGPLVVPGPGGLALSGR
jgi:hypothetical protein